MQNTFRVGDKVKIEECFYSTLNHNGKTGVITAVNSSTATVRMDGSKNSCDARKVSSAPGIMTKLKTLAKKMFDADTKVMVEAGYLTECLELTESGKEVIFTQFLLVPANKKAVADEAREVLKEQKESK